MGDTWIPEVIITFVDNGFVVRKANKAFIAFNENEVIQLVKVLLKEEKLPDPPF